jgi:alanine dehydrogenase
MGWRISLEMLGAFSHGSWPRRATDGEITVYKAMGLAMEDMVAANLAYRRAQREHMGGTMA